jgi:hypothetical protein
MVECTDISVYIDKCLFNCYLVGYIFLNHDISVSILCICYFISY